MPTKEEVGRRVRLARFRRDLTLKDVAVRSGMSATHISEIERGKTSPTIGALEKIASALEERPAHFVEEQTRTLAVLTPRKGRLKAFSCDADDRVIESELLTKNVPWGMTSIIRHVTEPGDTCHRAPVLGEIVVLCRRGMVRFTVAGDSIVLREGDTVQFPLDDGYLAENIGDERSECLTIAAFVTRKGW